LRVKIVCKERERNRDMEGGGSEGRQNKFFKH
jgi:hypothetical protein